MLWLVLRLPMFDVEGGALGIVEEVGGGSDPKEGKAQAQVGGVEAALVVAGDEGLFRSC